MKNLDKNSSQTADEHIQALGLVNLCETVAWISAILHVFFALKANENPLNGMPLIPREERTRAVLCVTDVISICARDKIGASALGMGL